MSKSLRTIRVRRCQLARINIKSGDIENVVEVDLSENRLVNWSEICDLLRYVSSVQILNLSENFLENVDLNSCFAKNLRLLNVSHNLITSFSSVSKIHSLDLSFNILSNISVIWPNSLISLNLSNNPLLHSIKSLSAPNLQYLYVENTGLKLLPPIIAQKLQHLSISSSEIETLDFDNISIPNLNEIDLIANRKLSFILGKLPMNILSFRLSDSMIQYLPSDFFKSSKKLQKVDILQNPWDCNKCLLLWTNFLSLSVRPQLNCSEDGSEDDCLLGISNKTEIIRDKIKQSAILPCKAYGSPLPFIEWWLTRPKRLIGSYDFANKKINLHWSRNESYRVIPGGYLVVQNVQPELVERYECIAKNKYGNVSAVIRFRLDLSEWYQLAIFRSVFWGSVFASIILCTTILILNILWIIIRKTGLWWIKRSERINRVSRMVEALEKYRQRQMANLHESYQKKIGLLRENYHQQVELLRTSYANQVGRFRDYRAAQIENVNQHIESIRDNYNQQKIRLREYGSRRAEQLWESYERQVNRIRTFSLQQRLRLMRTYKVKQRYLNKLFEKFNEDPQSTAYIKTLELEADASVRRSPSYYSLPDCYLLSDDRGGSIIGDVVCHRCAGNRRPSSHNILDDGPSTSQQVHRREQIHEVASASETNLQHLLHH